MPKKIKNAPPPSSPWDSEVRLLAWLATCVSVISFLYYFQRGDVLLYGDAIAHLNIARRVFDSGGLERQPHMADAHLNLALVYEKLGRIPDSLAHLSRYLRYDSQGNWAPYARKRLEAGRNAEWPY